MLSIGEQPSNTPQIDPGLSMTTPVDNPILTLKEDQAAPNPIQGDAAKNRAVRMHIAMGDKSPGIEAIQSMVSTGQEDYLRQQAVEIAKIDQQRKQTEYVQNLINMPELTPEQAQAAMKKLQVPQEANPKTAMEESFSQNYLQFLKTNLRPDSLIHQAEVAAPEATQKFLDANAKVETMRQLLSSAVEKQEQRVKDMGWGEYAWNTLEGMVPLAGAVRRSPDWSPSNILFSGSSLEQEQAKYWSFDNIGEAQAWLEKRIDEINASNPLDALHYAKSMRSLTREGVVVDNVFSIMDGQFVGALGKAAVIGVGASKLMRKVLKEGTDETGAVVPDKALEAAGDLKTAAELRTAKSITAGKDPLNNAAELIDRLPSLYNPGLVVKREPTNLSAQAQDRMLQTLKTGGTDLIDATTKGTRVPRMPPEAIGKAAGETSELIRLQYPSVNDSFLDSRNIYDPLTNTWVREHIIGRRDGTLFKTAAQAERYAQEELKLDYQSIKIGNQVPDAVKEAVKPKERLAQALKNKDARYKDEFTTAQVSKTLTANEKAIATLRNRIQNTPDAIKKAEYNKTLTNLEAEAGRQREFLNTAADAVKTPNRKKLDALVAEQAAIKDQGDYWYISITKPLNETSPGSREAILTTNNTNPLSVGGGYLNMVRAATLDKIRSAEDLLAHFQRGNRHLALHIPQEVQRVMAEKAMAIGSMRKDSREALEQILIANRDAIDYTLPPELQRGQAYTSQAQLERAWQDMHKRFPTEQESTAYWTHQQLMDLDWFMRNLGVARDLLRQGIEDYTVTMKGLKEGTSDINFKGRFAKDLPWESKQDYGILVLDKDGNGKHYWYRDLLKDEEAMANVKEIQKYRQVIQVANPTDKPFSGDVAGTGLTVNFVLTPDHKVKPLAMNLVDYNPGVHIQYPQPVFIKQPIVERSEKGKLVYYGDRTILAADSIAEGKRLSKALNDVQRMIANEVDDATLSAYISKHLPEDVDFWKLEFSKHIAKDQPIGEVISGRSFYGDMHKELTPTDMVNMRDTDLNLYRSIDQDFMAHRNGPLQQVGVYGTKDNPIYKMETARVLDPYVVMERTLNNSIRNLYLNDYKYGAIEQWVRQYAPVMEGDLQNNLANPFQTFYFAPFNEATGNREMLLAAKNTKERIVNFVGSRTEFGRDLDYIQTKLMDSMGKGDPSTMSALNPNKYLTARYYNDHELKFVKDPIAFTRAFMFHTIFGMFNPVHFFVQAQGFSHILGVAGPTAAAKGMAAYFLQNGRALNNNPQVLDRMANIATKFGWKKEHFEEVTKLMDNSGIKIIGKEHALSDNPFDPHYIKGTWDKILDKGTIPFKSGERLVRMVAFNAAYHEFRKANPFKEIDQFVMNDLMRRSDDLWANMTKASSSKLQEGAMAIPAQFYTFSQRMMEQMWGGRLTPKEKLRAFATHGMMYGIPVAAAAAVPWGLYDLQRKKVLAEYPELVDNPIYNIATNGFLSYAVEMSLGRAYNVEQRWGPGFSDKVAKMLMGDASFVEVATGAMGTFLSNVWAATLPFRWHLVQSIKGEGKDYPVTANDLMPLIREVSSANVIHNSIAAVNVGKFFSKPGNWVYGQGENKLDIKDAAMMLGGLMRRDITDMRLNLGTIKDQEEFQKSVMAKMNTALVTAMQYTDQGDKEKADVYYTKANRLATVIGDLTDKQIMQVLQGLENKPLFDRVMKSFMERGYKTQLPKRLQGLFDKHNRNP